MPKIRFIAHATLQGVAYRPGQELEVSQATADAYVRVQQAEVIPSLPAPPAASDDPETVPAGDLDETGPQAQSLGRKKVRRGGRPAETASRGAAEER